jgi:ribosomal protein S12 methylthiotransferase accessory factor
MIEGLKSHGNEGKAYKTGAHRTCRPEETIARFQPLASICGITRVANVTGLDYLGIPTYVASRPLARSLSVSMGKGATHAAAKASALMEALEFWHAEHIRLPLRYECAALLAKEERILAPQEFTTTVAIDDTRPLLWVEGRSLFDEEPIWVPFGAVHLNAVEPMEGGRNPFQVGSNGLASGNTMTEAIVHSVCELIERDATTLWFVDPREGSDKRTQVDLSTIQSSALRDVLDRIEAAGLHVGLFDTTTETEIPSFNAVLFDDPGPRAMGYFWGFGCHLDPVVAASRALTEAAQCRLAEITGAREDIAPEDFLQNRDDEELEEMKEWLSSPAATRDFHQTATVATDTVLGDLDVLRSALCRAEIRDAAVVDLSREELGVPVVKVLIPELEQHFMGSDHTLGARGRRIVEELSHV